jgi:hypothetical protein
LADPQVAQLRGPYHYRLPRIRRVQVKQKMKVDILT